MKFSAITLLCLSFFAAQKVAAQFECPDGGLEFYRNCQGSLDQCSTCLGDAESACEKKNRPVSCEPCTTIMKGRCDSSKKMCFGNQECGTDYACLNFECVYDPIEK